MVGIYLKITKLGYFNRDNHPFLSVLSVVSTRSIVCWWLWKEPVCWWWDENAKVEMDRVTADARSNQDWQSQSCRQSSAVKFTTVLLMCSCGSSSPVASLGWHHPGGDTRVKKKLWAEFRKSESGSCDETTAKKIITFYHRSRWLKGRQFFSAKKVTTSFAPRMTPTLVTPLLFPGGLSATFTLSVFLGFAWSFGAFPAWHWHPRSDGPEGSNLERLGTTHSSAWTRSLSASSAFKFWSLHQL